MKKIILLSVIALGFLVVPAFAEPTFSGSFSYGFHYAPEDEVGVEAYEGDEPGTIFEEGDHDASIEFTAAISDYTSLSAEFKGDDDSAVKVQKMILSQDVTGALGVDGPVGFSYKIGKQDYAPPDYGHFLDPGAKVGIEVVADSDNDKWYNEADGKYRGSDSKEIGIVMTFDLLEGLLKLDGAFYPKSLLDDNEDSTEVGVTLYGSAGPVDYAAYYAKSDRFDAVIVDSVERKYVDDEGDTIDDEGDLVGLNFKVTPIDGLVSTVLADYDLDSETAKAGLSVGYSIAGLTATVGADVEKIGIKKEDNNDEEWEAAKNLDVDLDLAYAIGGFESKVEFRSSLDDFSPNSNAKLTLAYTLGDVVFYGGAKMGKFSDFDAEADLTYEVGLKYTLDSVAFNVGYNNGSDYKAYYEKPKHTKGVYFNVTTSF